MVDHWWCWPRNKVSLGNSASSQTCFDQNPPPCQQLQYLADQTNIGRQHCDLYFQFVRLSRLTIMRIVVITWATLCAASFLRTPWNCHCWWQNRANPCKSHNAHTEPSLLCFSGNLFRWNFGQEPLSLPERWGLCLVLDLRKSEEEKKGATCQEKREEQKRRWGPERQLGI